MSKMTGGAAVVHRGFGLIHTALAATPAIKHVPVPAVVLTCQCAQESLVLLLLLLLLLLVAREVGRWQLAQLCYQAALEQHSDPAVKVTNQAFIQLRHA
jgi:hypothetical protein